MNSKKIVSGIYAVAIYFLLIYFVLLFYNVHEQKAKNYVEKNSNRVTVTLVNSDKTLLNKKSKINMPNRPVPKKSSVKRKPVSKKHHIKKHHIKKPTSKKTTPKKPIPKKPTPKKTPIKKETPKKDIEAIKKAERIKKIKEDNERAKLAELKKAKERAKQAEIKKQKEIETQKRKDREEAKQKEIEAQKRKEAEEAKKRAREERIRKDREKKERANSLFNSIETPKPSQSSHTATQTNQNQATHQSGRVSDKNREKGVENAYIAKIQRQLRNWPAQSNYQGDQVRINFTIYSSGRFKFRITRRSANPDFNSGITEYLKQLQRVGFGTHSKSTPYDIDVNFKAR